MRVCQSTQMLSFFSLAESDAFTMRLQPGISTASGLARIDNVPCLDDLFDVAGAKVRGGVVRMTASRLEWGGSLVSHLIPVYVRGAPIFNFAYERVHLAFETDPPAPRCGRP